jgi:hypothetical protein
MARGEGLARLQICERALQEVTGSGACCLRFRFAPRQPSPSPGEITANCICGNVCVVAGAFSFLLMLPLAPVLHTSMLAPPAPPHFKVGESMPGRLASPCPADPNNQVPPTLKCRGCRGRRRQRKRFATKGKSFSQLFLPGMDHF